MIPRRTLVTGGVLGSVIGGLVPGDEVAAAAPGPAAAADVSDQMIAQIVQAIAGLTTEVQFLKSFSDIAPVREVQKTFLRANGKFPDYLDVGADVWFGVHDWHVRWQQPMTLGKDSLGRYTIVLNQTVVILRPDSVPTFIGIPYDNR